MQDLSKLQEETINIRRCISGGYPMPEEVTSPSMMEPLYSVINAWRKIPPKLTSESLWVMLNIMVKEEGTSGPADYLLQEDRIQVIMELVKNSDTEIADNALWGICNFAGGNIQYRHKLLELGLYDVLNYVICKCKTNET